LIGGVSAAHSKGRTTYQFCNREVLTDSVVLLLFAGKVAFSCGIKGGFFPLGAKKRVTKANKNILYQLDDQSAFEYFHQSIGERTLFMNYCLAVYEKGQDNFYVRSAPFSDSAAGTVTLNGLVPEGAIVQIGIPKKETIVQSCAESLVKALTVYSGPKPAAALLISCAGRKLIMGTKIAEECNLVEKTLRDIPFCGFYAYGEFAPLEPKTKSLFHGATFVTLLVGSAMED
jgi:hypothetical protein